MSKIKRVIKKHKILLFVLVFAIAGASLLLIIRAATPTASIESENGSVTSPATKVTDGTASGGQYVQFKAAAAAGAIGPRPVSVTATGTVRSANTVSSICSSISASSGGDTVQIASGTYGALNCSAKSATSEVKIMPAPGASVNIAGTTIALGSRNLSFYNIRWTGGITISSYGTAAGAGSQNISFKGGRVDLPNTSTDGFSVGGGNTNLVFEDITLTGGDSHFTINCSSPSTCTDGIHILNNDSGRVAQDHVIINRGKNIHVRRNLLHDVIDSGEHSDGVQTVSVDGLWIERNKFYNSTADRDSFVDRHDQGIIINEIPSENRYNTNVHIYNNLFYNSIGTALAIAGGRDIEIYNNTIYDCGRNGSGSCVVLDADPVNTVQRISLWNNIFENFNNADATLTFNSNNTIGSFSGFVNPTAGDYHLKSALAGILSGTGIGGANIASPTIDLDGASRGNPPDRGAFEF